MDADQTAWIALLNLSEAMIWGFVGALAAIVLFKMAAGTINTRGLLRDKETGEFSPGRLQLLLLTLAGALAYVNDVTAARPYKLEAPEELLALVGASNLLYLGGKSRGLLRDFLKNIQGR